MHPEDPTTEPPPQDPKALPCIAFLLNVVRALIGYAKHLDQTLPEKTAHPSFPTIATCFGTHDLRRILGHVQRGLLKAMMLERYLLARAAQGRDIEPIHPPTPAEPKDIEALEIKLRPQPRPSGKKRRPLPLNPDDPLHFALPILKELEAQVRRQPIGQTIAEICLDLGITPSSCDGAFWHNIYQVLVHFGGDFTEFFSIRKRRRAAFAQERDKLPETWARDWLDRPKDAIREVLGFLLGDPPLPGAVVEPG